MSVYVYAYLSVCLYVCVCIFISIPLHVCVFYCKSVYSSASVCLCMIHVRKSILRKRIGKRECIENESREASHVEGER